MSAVTTNLVVSVDELRALARVTGLVLPAFVADDDSDDERIDLVALRGLMARGLVATVGPDPDGSLRLDDALAEVLEPARGAPVLAEVDEEVGDAAPRTWAVMGDDDGPTLIVAEHGPGLVALDRSPDPVAVVVSTWCRLDEVEASPDIDGFVVPLGAQTAADGAIIDGDGDESIAILTAAGAPSEAARRWVDAVAGRRRSIGVQVARRVGDEGPFEATELHWLVGPDGSAWMLRHADASADHDHLADGLDALDPEVIDAQLPVLVAPLRRDDLRRALLHALRPAARATTPGDR